jgi:hypothetical protein
LVVFDVFLDATKVGGVEKNYWFLCVFLLQQLYAYERQEMFFFVLVFFGVFSYYKKNTRCKKFFGFCIVFSYSKGVQSATKKN